MELRKYGFGIKPENSFGVAATIASADLLAVRPGTSFKGAIAQIADDVIRDTFSPNADINGIRSTSGKLSLRAEGGGATDPTPDFYRALDAAFGKTGVLDTAGALTHATTPCTTTVLTMKAGDGAKLTEGNAIAILIGTKYEVAWITDITADAVTVDPAFSGIPGVGVAVKRSMTWGPSDGVTITAEAVGSGDGSTTTFDLEKKDVDPGTLIGKVDGIAATCTLSVGTGALGVDQMVFAVAPAGAGVITANYRYANYGRSYTCKEFYGDNKSITHIGSKCAGLDINAETGQIVSLDFDWAGKDFTVGADNSPAFSSAPGNPTVGLNGKCVIGSTSYAIQKFTVSLKNTMEPLTDLSSTGYEDLRMTGREVSGSFTLKYSTQDFLNDFANAVTPKIFIQCGSTLGNILAVRIKKAKYTDVNITGDALRKNDVPFKSDYVDGADELFMSCL